MECHPGVQGSDPDVPLWISNRPRLDILPIVRDGYHDLRIAVMNASNGMGTNM